MSSPNHSGPDHLGLEIAFMAAQRQMWDARREGDEEAAQKAQEQMDETIGLIGELLTSESTSDMLES